MFVEEQKVPPVLELDARDFEESTVHLVGSDGGEVVAAARIIATGNATFSIGRVVVAKDFRGRGYGRKIIQEAAVVAARLLPAKTRGTLMLDAQEQAVSFYESCGFTLTDAPRFLDAGIWHREMTRTIFGSQRLAGS